MKAKVEKVAAEAEVEVGAEGEKLEMVEIGAEVAVGAEGEKEEMVEIEAEVAVGAEGEMVEIEAEVAAGAVEAKVEMVEIEAEVATGAEEGKENLMAEMVASRGWEESQMEKVGERTLKHLKSLVIPLCKLHTRHDLSWVAYNSMRLSCKCIDCLVWI
ncbi:hypothetical protein MRB53_027452 [Persea americana]|uniref:Uncharacterized protein n=1 Tax=Persea americana TaxID=3435 RepID=A0ACC2LM66_PERAE|nr:hypothetical protein MRB53_027452 [Persea americana]